MKTTKEYEICLNCESKHKCDTRICNKENYETAVRSQKENNNLTIPNRLLLTITISKDKHNILQNFYNKMNNIWYNFCLICNE